MANRISTVLDLDGSGWKATLGSIRSEMANTDGLINKLKVGWKSAGAEFNKSGTAQLAALGGIAVVAQQSIKAASNLEESVNAVNVVYGEAAEGVHALGEESATSFGMSQRAFNEFAVQFSSFANQVAGSSGREVSDVVQEMTTRVADFASVMNIDLADAAAVFQSALAGETEPIRRYGKDMSAAAVAAHAVKEGIAESASAMTEAQKVQARYSLLMKSTSDVAGDFANTSDSLANATRIATANFEDLQATLGKTLIPVVAELVDTMNQLAGAAEQVKGAFDQLPEPMQKVLGKLVNYPGLMADAIEWQIKFPISAGKTALGWFGIGEGADKAAKSTWLATEATQVWVGAAEAARGLAERIASATYINADAYEEAADAARNYSSADIAARDAAQDALDEWNEAAHEAFEADQQRTEDAIAQRQEDINAWREWRDSINSSTDSAEASLGDFIEDAETTFEEWRDELAKSIVAQAEWKNNLAQIGAETSAEFAAALADMGMAGAGLVDEIANDSSKLDQAFGLWAESANQAGRDLVGEMESIKAEAGSSAEGIGTAISQGMARGIQNAASQVGAAAAAAATQAMEDARAVMKIKSPSQVMADEVGAPMAEGIAEGIEDQADTISDAIKDALDGAMDAAEDRVDQAKDRLSDVLGGIGDRNSLEDAQEAVSDQEARLAEVRAGGDAEEISDAERALRRDNERLLREMLGQNGGTLTNDMLGIAHAAGWSSADILAYRSATVESNNATTAAASTAGVVSNYRIEVQTLTGQLSEAAIQQLIAILDEIERRRRGGA